MNNAHDIISAIIVREDSGFTNRAADRGGPTKFGITLDTLSRWRGHQCTALDVENLQEDEARMIYEHVYIDEPKFELVEDEGVRVQAIDWGVTSGPATAIKALQQLVGVNKDGVLGPATAAAVNAADLNNKLAVSRAVFYASIVERDTKQAANIVGWTRRALSFVR